MFGNGEIRGFLVTPEPGALVLLGTGLVVLAGIGWRRHRRKWAASIRRLARTSDFFVCTFGERIANTSPLRRWPPRPGPGPRDISCQTRTPATPGARCYSESGSAHSSAHQGWQPRLGDRQGGVRVWQIASGGRRLPGRRRRVLMLPTLRRVQWHRNWPRIQGSARRAQPRSRASSLPFCSRPRSCSCELQLPVGAGETGSWLADPSRRRQVIQAA
jgi:hypothetical protein